MRYDDDVVHGRYDQDSLPVPVPVGLVAWQFGFCRRTYPRVQYSTYHTVYPNVLYGTVQVRSTPSRTYLTDGLTQQVTDCVPVPVPVSYHRSSQLKVESAGGARTLLLRVFVLVLLLTK
jgi:hypothetical protein